MEFIVVVYHLFSIHNNYKLVGNDSDIFFASRAQSGKFGAFGAFLTGPFPGFDVVVL